MSCSCQWYRVCDAGALRAEPLATLMSCAVKKNPGWNPGFRFPGTQKYSKSPYTILVTRVKLGLCAVARMP